ncbi:MAG: arsenite efflux transporter metallochaperone ArsD [Chloroflexi bacterium]|nr:arsenite efflux transporter metallochaperone ArsD [Chloroflexota bacterium]
MTRSFVIYESAMCCSSGVCGPNPDKSLIDLQDALDKLKDMGAKVERYSITGNPKKFRENPEIIKLMQEHQIKALPITTYDGKVVKVGSYPGMDELRKCLKDSEADLSALADKNNGNDTCCSEQGNTFNEGCCAEQNSCDIRCAPNYKNSIRINTGGKCC